MKDAGKADRPAKGAGKGKADLVMGADIKVKGQIKRFETVLP